MYKFPVEYWVCICVSYFLLAAYSSNFRSSLGMNLKKTWKIFNSINSDQGRYLVGILKVHAYVNISSPRYYEPHLAECWFKYFLKPLISKQSNLNLAKRNTVNMKTFFFFWNFEDLHLVSHCFLFWKDFRKLLDELTLFSFWRVNLGKNLVGFLYSNCHWIYTYVKDVSEN